jgi:16S rRNA pseudouridine516 synthase
VADDRVRLDRLLANLGYGSRADASAIVRRGRVRIGEERLRDPATKVVPTEVTLDGEPLDHPMGVFVALNKPADYVCSRADSEGTPVFELLPDLWNDRLPRPEAVGRLDKDTTGLLLITDDHMLLHRLISPRHGVAKTYRVTLDRPATAEIVATLGSGELMLRNETDPCRPAELKLLDGNECELTITEGRYHQVKRMFGACGHKVEALHRTTVGPWSLDTLAPGEWRDVDPADLLTG